MEVKGSLSEDKMDTRCKPISLKIRALESPQIFQQHFLKPDWVAPFVFPWSAKFQPNRTAPGDIEWDLADWKSWTPLVHNIKPWVPAHAARAPGFLWLLIEQISIEDWSANKGKIQFHWLKTFLCVPYIKLWIKHPIPWKCLFWRNSWNLKLTKPLFVDILDR